MSEKNENSQAEFMADAILTNAETEAAEDDMYEIEIGQDAKLIKLGSLSAAPDADEDPQRPLFIDIGSETQLVDEEIRLQHRKSIDIAPDADEDLQNPLNIDIGPEAQFVDEEICLQYRNPRHGATTGELPFQNEDADIEADLRELALQMKNNTGLPDPSTLAEYGRCGEYSGEFCCLQRGGEWVVVRGVLWFGDYRTGIWRAVLNPASLSNVASICGTSCVGEQSKQIFEALSSEARFKNTNFFNDSQALDGLVPFPDGVFDVCSGTLLPPSLNRRITYALSLTYIACSEYSEIESFEKMVAEIAGSQQAADRLQEMMGIAIGAQPAGSILFIESANRKSASYFLKLLAAVTDEKAVSFVSLRDNEKNFRTAQLAGTHLVLSFKEGEATVRDFETALRLADGDGINADRKYLEPVDFFPCCTLVCAGKRLPRLASDDICEMADYIVRVKLDGSFPQNQQCLRPTFGLRCTFVMWAIEGLSRFLRRGFTTVNGCEIQSDTKSLAMFFDECICENPNASCPTRDLLNAYHNYCTERGMRECSEFDVKTFVRENYELRAMSVRAKDPFTGRSRVLSGYRGIQFISDAIEESLNRADDEAVDDFGDLDVLDEPKEDVEMISSELLS